MCTHALGLDLFDLSYTPRHPFHSLNIALQKRRIIGFMVLNIALHHLGFESVDTIHGLRSLEETMHLPRGTAELRNHFHHWSRVQMRVHRSHLPYPGWNFAIVESLMAQSLVRDLRLIGTYSLDQLAQSKMRYSNDNRSMISVLIYVVRNFGLGGLFRGLESKLLQTVSTTALMFMAYEKIAQIVFALLQVEAKKKAH